MKSYAEIVRLKNDELESLRRQVDVLTSELNIRQVELEAEKFLRISTESELEDVREGLSHLTSKINSYTAESTIEVRA